MNPDEKIVILISIFVVVVLFMALCIYKYKTDRDDWKTAYGELEKESKHYLEYSQALEKKINKDAKANGNNNT